jgi:hypothetical protein
MGTLRSASLIRKRKGMALFSINSWKLGVKQLQQFHWEEA